ncbi:LysR family transcriptional regulator [Hwanghaeella sp. LZ110]|uniref:LysR family transcriptional regulator n=1 Tax=Hwanghaeella sp. LZ110 TaxID=3402810 RepID=UPI003B67B476
MDWEHLRHFAAFAETGSLSAAAREIGVEHATIARRIASLEETLALKLIDRRGRKLTLTAEGIRIAEIARRMTRDTEEITRIAAGVRSEVSGHVIISAPPALTALCLVTPLVALQSRHPNLIITLIGESRTASLERREADLAIRLSRPETGPFKILKLGDMPFRLYATPAYLNETDEKNWRFIGYGGAMKTAPQQLDLDARAQGRSFRLMASSVEIQLAAAKAGAGIAILPEFLADSETDLTRIPLKNTPFHREIWLVVHDDLQNSAPIRTVIETLKTAFSKREQSG